MKTKLEKLIQARRDAEMLGNLVLAREIHKEIAELGKPQPSSDESEKSAPEGGLLGSQSVMTASRGLVTGSEDSPTGSETSFAEGRNQKTDSPSQESEGSEEESSEDSTDTNSTPETTTDGGQDPDPILRNAAGDVITGSDEVGGPAPGDDVASAVGVTGAIGLEVVRVTD